MLRRPRHISTLDSSWAIVGLLYVLQLRSKVWFRFSSRLSLILTSCLRLRQKFFALLCFRFLVLYTDRSCLAVFYLNYYKQLECTWTSSRQQLCVICTGCPYNNVSHTSSAYWCILSTTTGRRHIWLTVSLPQPTSAVVHDFASPAASTTSNRERGWNSASAASSLLAQRLGTVFRLPFNNCLTLKVLNVILKLFFSSGVTALLSSFNEFLCSMFSNVCNALVTLLAVSVVSYELMNL